jgi:uncharacterized membrane protein YgcG
MQSIDTVTMSEPFEDSRNRPVVFQTHAEALPRSHRRPVRVLVTITLVLVALAGATGLAFGGSAVWSVIGPKAGTNEPAPLWIPEPTPIGAAANKQATEFDGDRTTPTNAGAPPGHAGAPATQPEPGDDNNRGSTPTTATNSDKGPGSGASPTTSASGGDGSGGGGSGSGSGSGPNSRGGSGH